MFGLCLEMLRAVEDAVRMGADPADFRWRSFGRHRRGGGGNGRTCGIGSGPPEHRRGARCEANGMDKTIRKYASLDEMKAGEYRYWRSRPVHGRVAAVSELTEEGYRMEGMGPDAFRLQRTLVHFQRAPR